MKVYEFLLVDLKWTWGLLGFLCDFIYLFKKPCDIKGGKLYNRFISSSFNMNSQALFGSLREGLSGQSHSNHFCHIFVGPGLSA